MAVRIVTDSTCDLPRDLVQKWGITVVPLIVRFGDEAFFDGVSLTADEFYRRLTEKKVHPTTAAPAPGVFAETYRSLLAQRHQVLSIHLSSKLSATYTSAMNGKADVGDKPIEVIDSPTVSMGLGLLVLLAAEAAASGKGLAEVARTVRARMPDIKLYGAFDTLEYLHRGGRIGKASAMLGSLLNLKPIVLVADGEVHPFERVRTRARARGRLVDLVAGANVEKVAVMHSTTPSEMDEFAKQVSAAAKGGDAVKTQFGPVLGTYVGPGVLGVGFLEGRR